MNRLNVFFQFDNNYAVYAGVSLTSLLENNKSVDNIHIYILGDNLSTNNLNRFQHLETIYKNCTINLIDANKTVDKIKELHIPSYRNSQAANLRLFFDQLIEDDIERIIYIDSDTIINDSLLPLINSNLHGKTVGMVIDAIGREHKAHLNFSPNELYYNSGVILYDVSKWKEKKYSEKIVLHVTKIRSDFVSPDQDILNQVLKNDIQCLPMKYNYQPIHSILCAKNYLKLYGSNGYYSLEEIVSTAQTEVIFHSYRFLGEFPWHKNNLHPDSKLFDFYLNKSQWKDYIKLPASVNFIMKIEKILYRLLPKYLFMKIFKFVYKINNDFENKKCLNQHKIKKDK